MSSGNAFWMSLRGKFTPSDNFWGTYIEFIGLAHLQEVRSIDPGLNEVVADEEVLSNFEEALQYDGFREPDLTEEYCLLYVAATDDVVSYHHPRLKLLGYDLAENTGGTSSLLNCGQWQGALEPIARRTRTNGLLELADAKLAQKILPDVWNADPHSFVVIWSLFEVAVNSKAPNGGP